MKQAILEFLEYLKLANKSAQTIRQYRGVLLDFQKLIGEIPQAQLDIPHIEAYLEALHERKLSKVSISRAVAILKSFCKWMTGEEILRENPADAFRGPRRPHRIRPRATEEEMERIIASTIRSFPERDRLILELGYGSGLRNDELANIQIEDFMGGDQLLVSKGKGHKQRIVLLTEPARQALKLYLKKRKLILQKHSEVRELKGQGHSWQEIANRLNRKYGLTLTTSAYKACARHRPDGNTSQITSLFFGLDGSQNNALDPRSILRIVTKSAIAAGVPWLRPHDLRRAFATHMGENGASHPVIQRLLGHKLLSTTEGYIAASSPERLKATYLRARAAHPQAP
jgi:integrase/recombinase XerD